MVFTSLEDMAARVDDPDLDVTADDILVLQNAGPRSAAAMPEAGFLPIPKKLLGAGVKDMVRISDARMSGTAYGTIVLHVAPEAAVGGPLALVRTGDRIRLSVEGAPARSAGGRGGAGARKKAAPGVRPGGSDPLRAATTSCSARPCCRPPTAATSIFSAASLHLPSSAVRKRTRQAAGSRLRL